MTHQLLQVPDPVQELPGTQPGQFDVCIANILQGPLLDLHPRLAGYVRPGGHLLLSGILTSQVIYQAHQCCLYASSCLAALSVETLVTVASTHAFKYCDSFALVFCSG